LTIPEAIMANRSEHVPEPSARLLRVEEAALILGVGRTTAFQLIANGSLATVRIGRRRLVPRAALDQFLRSLERGVDL
jgi:excisionase family DNA binding protein